MEAWLQITSGRGPSECALVVAKVCDKVITDARAKQLKAEVINAEPGYEPKTFASVMIALSGEAAGKFVEEWSGTLQWTAKSTFRPNHKRKNWFVGVAGFIPPDETNINMTNVKLETMRAAGPGGQNVNKVATAVRLTHIPTGIAVVAREERSQSANRRLASAKLLIALKELEENKAEKASQDQWGKHNSLERGNPNKTFKEAF